MDKVRECLLAVEASPEPMLMTGDLVDMFDSENADVGVGYLQMLASAGYLEGTGQRGVYRLSWAGHEFIDSVRDPEIWKQTKTGAGAVGSWSVGLLAELAKGYIRAKAVRLGLPLG